MVTIHPAAHKIKLHPNDWNHIASGRMSRISEEAQKEIAAAIASTMDSDNRSLDIKDVVAVAKKKSLLQLESGLANLLKGRGVDRNPEGQRKIDMNTDFFRKPKTYRGQHPDHRLIVKYFDHYSRALPDDARATIMHDANLGEYGSAQRKLARRHDRLPAGLDGLKFGDYQIETIKMMAEDGVLKSFFLRKAVNSGLVIQQDIDKFLQAADDNDVDISSAILGKLQSLIGGPKRALSALYEFYDIDQGEEEEGDLFGESEREAERQEDLRRRGGDDVRLDDDRDTETAEDRDENPYASLRGDVGFGQFRNKEWFAPPTEKGKQPETENALTGLTEKDFNNLNNEDKAKILTQAYQDITDEIQAAARSGIKISVPSDLIENLPVGFVISGGKISFDLKKYEEIQKKKKKKKQDKEETIRSQYKEEYAARLQQAVEEGTISESEAQQDLAAMDYESQLRAAKDSGKEREVIYRTVGGRTFAQYSPSDDKGPPETHPGEKILKRYSSSNTESANEDDQSDSELAEPYIAEGETTSPEASSEVSSGQHPDQDDIDWATEYANISTENEDQSSDDYARKWEEAYNDCLKTQRGWTDKEIESGERILGPNDETLSSARARLRDAGYSITDLLDDNKLKERLRQEGWNENDIQQGFRGNHELAKQAAAASMPDAMDSPDEEEAINPGDKYSPRNIFDKPIKVNGLHEYVPDQNRPVLGQLENDQGFTPEAIFVARHIFPNLFIDNKFAPDEGRSDERYPIVPTGSFGKRHGVAGRGDALPRYMFFADHLNKYGKLSHADLKTAHTQPIAIWAKIFEAILNRKLTLQDMESIDKLARLSRAHAERRGWIQTFDEMKSPDKGQWAPDDQIRRDEKFVAGDVHAFQKMQWDEEYKRATLHHRLSAQEHKDTIRRIQESILPENIFAGLSLASSDSLDEEREGKKDSAGRKKDALNLFIGQLLEQAKSDARADESNKTELRGQILTPYEVQQLRKGNITPASKNETLKQLYTLLFDKDAVNPNSGQKGVDSFERFMGAVKNNGGLTYEQVQQHIEDKKGILQETFVNDAMDLLEELQIRPLYLKIFQKQLGYLGININLVDDEGNPAENLQNITNEIQQQVDQIADETKTQDYARIRDAYVRAGQTNPKELQKLFGTVKDTTTKKNIEIPASGGVVNYDPRASLDVVSLLEKRPRYVPRMDDGGLFSINSDDENQALYEDPLPTQQGIDVESPAGRRLRSEGWLDHELTRGQRDESIPHDHELRDQARTTHKIDEYNIPDEIKDKILEESMEQDDPFEYVEQRLKEEKEQLHNRAAVDAALNAGIDYDSPDWEPFVSDYIKKTKTWGPEEYDEHVPGKKDESFGEAMERLRNHGIEGVPDKLSKDTWVDAWNNSSHISPNQSAPSFRDVALQDIAFNHGDIIQSILYDPRTHGVTGDTLQGAIELAAQVGAAKNEEEFNALDKKRQAKFIAQAQRKITQFGMSPASKPVQTPLGIRYQALSNDEYKKLVLPLREDVIQMLEKKKNWNSLSNEEKEKQIQQEIASICTTQIRINNDRPIINLEDNAFSIAQSEGKVSSKDEWRALKPEERMSFYSRATQEARDDKSSVTSAKLSAAASQRFNRKYLEHVNNGYAELLKLSTELLDISSKSPRGDRLRAAGKLIRDGVLDKNPDLFIQALGHDESGVPLIQDVSLFRRISAPTSAVLYGPAGRALSSTEELTRGTVPISKQQFDRWVKNSSKPVDSKRAESIIIEQRKLFPQKWDLTADQVRDILNDVKNPMLGVAGARHLTNDQKDELLGQESFYQRFLTQFLYKTNPDTGDIIRDETGNPVRRYSEEEVNQAFEKDRGITLEEDQVRDAAIRGWAGIWDRHTDNQKLIEQINNPEARSRGVEEQKTNLERSLKRGKITLDEYNKTLNMFQNPTLYVQFLQKTLNKQNKEISNIIWQELDAGQGGRSSQASIEVSPMANLLRGMIRQELISRTDSPEGLAQIKQGGLRVLPGQSSAMSNQIIRSVMKKIDNNYGVPTYSIPMTLPSGQKVDRAVDISVPKTLRTNDGTIIDNPEYLRAKREQDLKTFGNLTKDNLWKMLSLDQNKDISKRIAGDTSQDIRKINQNGRTVFRIGENGQSPRSWVLDVSRSQGKHPLYRRVAEEIQYYRLRQGLSEEDTAEKIVAKLYAQQQGAQTLLRIIDKGITPENQKETAKQYFKSQLQKGANLPWESSIEERPNVEWTSNDESDFSQWWESQDETSKIRHASRGLWDIIGDNPAAKTRLTDLFVDPPSETMRKELHGDPRMTDESQGKIVPGLTATMHEHLSRTEQESFERLQKEQEKEAQKTLIREGIKPEGIISDEMVEGGSGASGAWKIARTLSGSWPRKLAEAMRGQLLRERTERGGPRGATYGEGHTQSGKDSIYSGRYRTTPVQDFVAGFHDEQSPHWDRLTKELGLAPEEAKSIPKDFIVAPKGTEIQAPDGKKWDDRSLFLAYLFHIITGKDGEGLGSVLHHIQNDPSSEGFKALYSGGSAGRVLSYGITAAIKNAAKGRYGAAMTALGQLISSDVSFPGFGTAINSQTGESIIKTVGDYIKGSMHNTGISAPGMNPVTTAKPARKPTDPAYTEDAANQQAKTHLLPALRSQAESGTLPFDDDLHDHVTTFFGQLDHHRTSLHEDVGSQPLPDDQLANLEKTRAGAAQKQSRATALHALSARAHAFRTIGPDAAQGVMPARVKRTRLKPAASQSSETSLSGPATPPTPEPITGIQRTGAAVAQPPAPSRTPSPETSSQTPSEPVTPQSSGPAPEVTAGVAGALRSKAGSEDAAKSFTAFAPKPFPFSWRIGA